MQITRIRAKSVVMSGAIIFASILGVLAYTSFGSAPHAMVDLEEEWARAISQYRIEPVFPPEEDVAVGDIFVQLVDDSDPSGSVGEVVGQKTNFRARSVKIDHVDVRSELDAYYRKLPVFSQTGIASAQATNCSNGDSTIVEENCSPHNLFRGSRRDLPIAAFASSSLLHSSSAQTEVSGRWRSWFSFGRSAEQMSHIDLPLVETYGLPSRQAMRVLREYCRDHHDYSEPYGSAVKVCSSKNIRQHLVPLMQNSDQKKRLFAEIVDLQTGGYKYVVTVRIIMVSRVYLARAIHNRTKVGTTHSGAGGSGQTGQFPGITGSGQMELTTADQSKLEVPNLEERRQSRGRSDIGGSMRVASTASQDIVTSGVYLRPVAVGYRYVEYDLN